MESTPQASVNFCCEYLKVLPGPGNTLSLFDSATASRKFFITMGDRMVWQLFAIEGEACSRTLPLPSV